MNNLENRLTNALFVGVTAFLSLSIVSIISSFVYTNMAGKSLEQQKVERVYTAYCESATRNAIDLEGCLTLSKEHGIDFAKKIF